MKKDFTKEDSPEGYLDKSFLEELNFKLWSTKAARFNCDQRLRKKGNVSNIGLSIISAYLIIASLITVFNLKLGISQEILNFAITALSILVLVFTQFENAQNYELKAKIHHDCGLRIAELYNELRIFKTLVDSPRPEETLAFAKTIVKKYDAVLSTSSNHDGIDYKRFLIANWEWMQKNEPKKIKNKSRRKIQFAYYWNIYGWYVLLIITPPILIYILSIFEV